MKRRTTGGDYMNCRRASDVLRDIVRWYHELVQLPGFKFETRHWAPELIKPLYIKHGLPGSRL